MNIQELKAKTSEQLIDEAEKLNIENASTLRRQEILFAILKKHAEKGEEITGSGVLQLLQDGFGFSEPWSQIIFLDLMISILAKSNQKVWFKNWRYCRGYM